VPTAPRPQQRVADLVSDEPAPKFNVPAKQGDDLSQRPFEQIYRDAGVTNTPCSVDELATLMENPMVANQPLSVKIIAVNLTLSAKGIGIDVPIADAARRDRALDAYQAMLAQRANQVEQRNAEKVQQLSKEVEEYLKKKQAEMEALKSEASETRRQSIDFSVRREAEEKRLADLISPFLEGKPNPVTIGNQPDSEANQS
jgi:TRAP-type C4-dicarboxylate transport system substrate-binding protein